MSIRVFRRLASGVAAGGLGRNRARRGALGLLVASLGIHCVVGGCGTTPEESVTLDVVFDRTGTLTRDGAFENMTQDLTALGDIGVPLRTYCAFVSLNLNLIPATANVTRVVLNFTAVAGRGNPFDDFGAVTVDHVNVLNGITASDYVGGTIKASIGTIPPFPTDTRRPVAIDVTSEVNVDRAAGRPISSFRFRFDAAPSNDGLVDEFIIDTSPEDPAQRPSGRVTMRR